MAHEQQRYWQKIKVKLNVGDFSSDRAIKWYFQGGDDCDCRSKCHGKFLSPVSWVSFQALRCDILGFEDEDKRSLCSFFLTVSSHLHIQWSLFFIFSVVFSCWSFSNIQRNMCFHGMFVHDGRIVSNSLLACTLWAGVFFLSEIYFYIHCGYLHRNFWNLLYFTAYFLQTDFLL